MPTVYLADTPSGIRVSRHYRCWCGPRIDSFEHTSHTPEGDGLLRVALALFAIGFVAIVAIFLTPVLSDSEPGLVLYLIALACPIGFLLGIVAALRQGRRSR